MFPWVEVESTMFRLSGTSTSCARAKLERSRIEIALASAGKARLCIGSLRVRLLYRLFLGHPGHRQEFEHLNRGAWRFEMRVILHQVDDCFAGIRLQN